MSKVAAFADHNSCIQMATIIGDVLLTSAVQAYAGYFDQHMRQNLFTTWSTHLQQASIVFKPDLARIEVHCF